MGQLIDFPGFISPAYRLETPHAACSRMVNVYPEVIEKGPYAGKLRARGIPGFKDFATLSDSPLRALLRIDGGNRCFAVAGGTVFEVFRDGTFQALTGSVGPSPRRAQMATNGFQIVVASAGQLYMVNAPSNPQVFPLTFTDGTPIRANSVDFLDQYFIASLVDSKQVVISNLAPDGATWDPGDAAIKEGYPDNIARVFADNQQLWLFGFDTIEPWVDTGELFPFGRAGGPVLKYGATAPDSVAGALGRRWWLFKDAVYEAYGVFSQRVSDFGVESAIRSYGDVSDAEAYCYTIGGHLFYVISFPNANRTWCYDANFKAWHERGYWDQGRQNRYRGRVYANAFGKDLVGDYQSGKIYELDEATYTDAGGAALRREIVSPYFTERNRNVRYNQLVLDIDTGVGIVGLPDVAGVDPQLIFRYSDNRGKDWSSELQATVGPLGDDFRRVVFNQLGSSRLGKVFDVVFTDPCEFNVMGAWVNLGNVGGA